MNMRIFLFLIVFVGATSILPAVACDAIGQPSEDLLEKLGDIEATVTNPGAVEGLLTTASNCADSHAINASLAFSHSIVGDFGAAAAYMEAAFETGWGTELQRAEMLRKTADYHLNSDNLERASQLYEQALEHSVELKLKIIPSLVRTHIGLVSYDKAAYWADQFNEMGGIISTPYTHRLFAIAYAQTCLLYTSPSPRDRG